LSDRRNGRKNKIIAVNNEDAYDRKRRLAGLIVNKFALGA
jgi:hypothetical protein